ncbi:glycosyltransferase [Shouchella sp. JSM 1781072]|uniref:glycosyltransferase n=1 Tax=Shouchella sp. JSM 1781072 TaxID=3344581 RepID=UPI0035BED993
MAQRIDLLINSLRGGGAEKVCTTIANGLIEQGFEVNLIVIDLNKAVYLNRLHANVNLVNLETKRARSSFSALLKYVNKYEPEKMLVFNYELTFISLFARAISKKRFHIISRSINTLSEVNKEDSSQVKKTFKNFLVKKIYSKANLIIAQSEGMKGDLVKNIKIPSKKIEIIHNPIDFNILKKTLKDDYKKSTDFLFIGRLETQKNLFQLLDAFRLCLIEVPNLKLRLVGEGSLKDELIAYSSVIKIEENVQIDSFVEDVIPVYKSAKVTVLSSNYEGFPNVLLESIVLGTPVVSYDCPSGPAEIIKDKENGFLVENGNVEMLAEKMLKALDFNWNKEKLIKSMEQFMPLNIILKYVNIITK